MVCFLWDPLIPCQRQKHSNSLKWIYSLTELDRGVEKKRKIILGLAQVKTGLNTLDVIIGIKPNSRYRYKAKFVHVPNFAYLNLIISKACFGLPKRTVIAVVLHNTYTRLYFSDNFPKQLILTNIGSITKVFQLLLLWWCQIHLVDLDLF